MRIRTRCGPGLAARAGASSYSRTLPRQWVSVFLDDALLRQKTLIKGDPPNARLARSCVAAAREIGYFEGTSCFTGQPPDRLSHGARIATMRRNWLELRDGERLVFCDLNKDERTENPGGTYYLQDGLGRLLPYLYLVVYEGYEFCPIEAFLADDVFDATTTDFFDRYDRFYQTSAVGSAPARLNARYRAIIAANVDCIRGSTILDIASHDGRWSFAALRAGAIHVLGVESDFRLTQAAEATFAAYDVSASAYTFATCDVYDLLPGLPVHSIDTVLCLGFVYHTMHHQSLFSLIAGLRPKHLIVDTCVASSADAIIVLKIEEMATGLGFSAWHGPVARTCVVGTPSRRALDMMLADAGFRIHTIDWQTMHIQDWSGIEDYRDGRRMTVRAEFDG